MSADLAAPVVLNGTDLEASTVLDLQREFGAGRLTSVALTAFYLERIKAVDPVLNSVIMTSPDALDQAAESDARRVRGEAPLSPLDGIPVLLKDNIGYGPTTAGSLALADSSPAEAFIATRLRAAGAVVLGKSNLSEWANFRSTASTSGWSAVGGQTANPYALDRNPCGSSSGSGAAAAANLASVTVGTETDGSIVCPSGLCGVVGLKPTLGLVSRSGIVPISSAQDTAGPMARTVTDAAVLLGVLAGEDPEDPATAGFAAEDYTAYLDADALRGKRIGVWLDMERQGDPGSAALAVFNGAVARLTDLGATAVPVRLPYLDVVEEHEFPALEHEFKIEIAAYLGRTPGPHPGNLAGLIAFNEANAETELALFGQEVFLSAEATSGSPTDPRYLAMREAVTSAARRSLDETLAGEELDAIVTLGNAPAWLTADSAGGGDPIGFQSSTPAAVSGYPSVIVPMGFVGALPVGLSFIGARGSDGALLGLAFAFEQGTRARRAPRFLATGAEALS